MRRLVFTSLLVAGAAGPAFADCTEEVVKAYDALSKKPFVKMETMMITGTGPVKMVLEFITPDKMRQTVTSISDNKTVESIVIGDKAWTQEAEGWFELPPQAADEFATFRDQSLGFKDNKVKFDCMGAEKLDGVDVRSYKMLDPTVTINGKEMPRNPTNNEGIRVYYINATTGLPERAIYAQKDRLNVPIHRESYTFPEAIKIDPPANVQPPPALVNEPKDLTKEPEKK